MRLGCGPCSSDVGNVRNTGRTLWSAPPSSPVGGRAGRTAATHTAIAYVLA